MSQPVNVRVFQPSELMPAAWRPLAQDGPSRLFNPALIAAPHGGYILAYRVVLPDNLRRLAICRLDRSLNVVPGSPLPLSDLLSLPHPGYSRRATQWFADPRLIPRGNHLLLHWNTGSHEPENHQFVQSLSPESLLPASPSFELRLASGQTAIEKNWGLFPGPDGQLLAVYSISPLRILRCTDAAQATELSIAGWDCRPWSRRFGVLRGGAPPVLVDGSWYLFTHSQYRTRAGTCYIAGLVTFSAATEPFIPQAFLPEPLPLPNPFDRNFLHSALNTTVAKVLYPCGAVQQNGEWLISYGINDEHCAIARIGHADLLRRLRPAEPSARRLDPPDWEHSLLPRGERWQRAIRRWAKRWTESG